jgi:hypothetical protein
MILDATVGHRRTFRRVVRENTRFQLVEVKGWAGLGAVRYVPRKFVTSGKSVDATPDDAVIEEQPLDGVPDGSAEGEKVLRKMADLTESEKQEIDKLNIELVVQLRGTDSAFSKGEVNQYPLWTMDTKKMAHFSLSGRFVTLLNLASFFICAIHFWVELKACK